MPKILITGAGGVLGSNIVAALNNKEYQIYALDIKKEFMVNKIHSQTNVIFVDVDNLEEIPFQELDCIIHCAFSRSQQGKDLASSIDFSQNIFEKAVKNQIPAVINISSQSIYGSFREKPSHENSEVDPLDCYAISKYACEKLAEKISYGTRTKITSIRLSSLIGPQFNERLTNKMIVSAKENKKINIVGGTQIFSFLDIRDAVDGLISMLKINSSQWKSIYNLGTSEQYNIMQIANNIASIMPNTTIELNEKDINTQIRLDCTHFYQDFKWKPKYKLLDSLKNIAENIIND